MFLIDQLDLIGCLSYDLLTNLQWETSNDKSKNYVT